MNNFTAFSGNSFIDDNHIDLLEHLNSLLNIPLENKDQLILKDEFNKFIINIENHFHHEEIILKGANYKDLENHIIFHRDISLKLRKYNNVDYNNNSDAASSFLEKAASNIIEHEMMQDQQYWSLFSSDKNDDLNILQCSDNYNTNNSKIDSHHIALLNHINRFYVSCISKEDIHTLINELKTLCLYSRYHFSEEEKLLGDKLSKQHKINHTKLIRDLETLIVEIKHGKFQIKSLPEYFNYWFLNHLCQYDLPAFSND